MKTHALLLLLALSPISIFGQVYVNHTVALPDDFHFIKLPYMQVIDSCNMNQQGPEQFETFDIKLKKAELANIDSFMASVRSIDQIIQKYGEPYIDFSVGSNQQAKRPLSGFYYAVQEKDKYMNCPMLSVIYPRFEDFERK